MEKEDVHASQVGNNDKNRQDNELGENAICSGRHDGE